MSNVIDTWHVFVCYCYCLLCVFFLFFCVFIGFHSAYSSSILYIFDVYINYMQCNVNGWTAELNQPIRFRSDTHSTESIHINGRLEKCERRPTHKTDIFAVLCTQLLFRLRQQQQSVSTTARHFQNTYSYIYIDRDGETTNNAVNLVIIMFWVGE